MMDKTWWLKSNLGMSSRLVFELGAAFASILFVYVALKLDKRNFPSSHSGYINSVILYWMISTTRLLIIFMWSHSIVFSRGSFHRFNIYFCACTLYLIYPEQTSQVHVYIPPPRELVVHSRGGWKHMVTVVIGHVGCWQAAYKKPKENQGQWRLNVSQ